MAIKAEPTKALEPLFQPWQLGKLRLRNRLVMSPMSRYFAHDGVPNAGMAAYYRRRAEGGVGLVITEGTAPPHSVAQYRRTVPRCDDAALEHWAAVVHGVHGAGARIFLQLWHAGMARLSEESKVPADPSIGPSGIFPGRPDGRTMTQADIDRVIACYVAAAQNARRLGFDGVNIHAAHGYLIDEFFWPRTNLRTDHYGGDLIGRLRFAVEIVQAVRQHVGADFPIMLRFSQWKTADYGASLFSSPAELADFLQPLVSAGVDVFDVSTRQFWLPAFAGSGMCLAAWTKQLSGRPVMAVGCVGVGTPRTLWAPGGDKVAEVSADSLLKAADMLGRGAIDLAAIGRALLVNPDLPKQIRNGEFSALKPYRPSVLQTLECSQAP